MRATSKLHLLHMLTLIFIGSTGYILADIIHEVLGHGGSALLLHNRITLVSSVYFRTEPHSFISDAAGPLCNLFAGLFLWKSAERFKPTGRYMRCLLVVAVGCNLFWFSWICIYGGVTNKGDFAFYIPRAITSFCWRMLLIIGGGISYFLSWKMVRNLVSSFQLYDRNYKRIFLVPYLSGCMSSMVVVSFFRPAMLVNFYEAFLFPMFLPLLFIQPAEYKLTQVEIGKEGSVVREQLWIILAGLCLLILFACTMGPGIRL